MHNPIDARQLSNFCEIAQTRSIRKAAKNLNLSTSAISHSLKRLEEDLGCKLFERDTRNLSLTHAGRRLHSLADDILGTLTRARRLVHEWDDAGQRTLRIGASSAACQYIIPTALRELKESFPSMNIQIIPGSSYQLLEAIDECKVEVAIFPWFNTEKSSHISIGTDRLKFIVHPLHPWVKDEKVASSSIEAQRIILPDSKGYTYDLVNDYFQSYRKNIMPFIEISNEEVIKRLVELDIGIGILPDWIIRKEQADGTLKSFPLGRKDLERNWIVAHQDSKPLSFSETLFVGVVTDVARSLFSDLLQ